MKNKELDNLIEYLVENRTYENEDVLNNLMIIEKKYKHIYRNIYILFGSIEFNNFVKKLSINEREKRQGFEPYILNTLNFLLNKSNELIKNELKEIYKQKQINDPYSLY